MNETELGSFLRARRESLRPVDVGLTDGHRRRTPGLRRAEVALLANVSVDYYERLEQARAGHPSRSLLVSLARALRLSADEHEYLHHLAGTTPTIPRPVHSGVDPGMSFVLDSLTTVPAHAIDDLGNVLGQNALSVALLGRWAEETGRWANVFWRWFTAPEARARDFLEDDPQTGRRFVADLRAAAAARGHDKASTALIAELTSASAEFADYWKEMEVQPIRSRNTTLHHPRLGPLQIRYDVVQGAVPGQQLIMVRPQPGTDTGARLATLQDHALPALV